MATNPTDAQVKIIGYTGDGTFGKANPKNITFPFEPKLVIISRQGGLVPGARGWKDSFIWFDPQSLVTFEDGTMSKIVRNGKTISICSTIKAKYQMNEKNMTYYCIGIGL